MGKQMKIFSRKTKKDNKGMSLVELVIAAAILTIVVAPLLRVFAQSFYANSDSRLRQDANVVSKSIMESFKSYGVTLDDMVSRYNGGIIPTAMSFDSANGTGAKDTGYTYTITNGVTDTNSHFNATIEVTPRVAGGASTDPNEEELLYVQPRTADQMLTWLDSEEYFNAVIDEARRVLAQKLTDYALADMTDGGVTLPDPAYTMADIAASNIEFASRKIVIELLPSEVTFHIEYQTQLVSALPYVNAKGYHGTYDPGTLKFQLINNMGTVEAKIMGPTDSDEIMADLTCADTLRDLYLYIMPLYEVGMDKDEIVVSGGFELFDDDGDGTADQKGRIFLLKQRLPDMSDTQINSLEASYRTKMDFMGASQMFIYHNFEDFMIPEAASPVAGTAPDISLDTSVISTQECSNDVSEAVNELVQRRLKDGPAESSKNRTDDIT